ncbi:MAG: hypothetical protein ABI972_05650 [Acidobacteriota bacterium]
MTVELTGFFPIPERADAALGKLGDAGFDVDSASLVTGEDAKSALHRRLATARRGRAATGAMAGGGIAVLLSAVLFLPAIRLEGPYPWLILCSLTALSAMLAAGLGAFYGMGVEKHTVLIGLSMSRERVGEAKRILRAAGARFLAVRANGS